MKRQAGFIDPFIDLLFGAFGVILVIAIVFMAQQPEVSSPPVDSLFMIKADEESACGSEPRIGVSVVYRGSVFRPGASGSKFQFSSSQPFGSRHVLVVSEAEFQSNDKLQVYLVSSAPSDVAECVSGTTRVYLTSEGSSEKELSLNVNEPYICVFQPNGSLVC